MASVTHPDKQKVRELMEKHRAEKTPPMPPEVIREQLGWKMIPENKAAK